MYLDLPGLDRETRGLDTLSGKTFPPPPRPLAGTGVGPWDQLSALWEQLQLDSHWPKVTLLARVAHT